MSLAIVCGECEEVISCGTSDSYYRQAECNGVVFAVSILDGYDGTISGMSGQRTINSVYLCESCLRSKLPNIFGGYVNNDDCGLFLAYDHANESISEISDGADGSSFRISTIGCQANVCEIKRPSAGHNGACKCLADIPKAFRIPVRKWLMENWNNKTGKRHEKV